MDLFDKPKLDLNNITCHSGGALSDTSFELIGERIWDKTKAYSYKTNITQVTIKLRLVMMILRRC
jgi:cytochrome c peroxidase